MLLTWRRCGRKTRNSSTAACSRIAFGGRKQQQLRPQAGRAQRRQPRRCHQPQPPSRRPSPATQRPAPATMHQPAAAPAARAAVHAPLAAPSSKSLPRRRAATLLPASALKADAALLRLVGAEDSCSSSSNDSDSTSSSSSSSEPGTDVVLNIVARAFGSTLSQCTQPSLYLPSLSPHVWTCTCRFARLDLHQYCVC